MYTKRYTKKGFLYDFLYFIDSTIGKFVYCVFLARLYIVQELMSYPRRRSCRWRRRRWRWRWRRRPC